MVNAEERSSNETSGESEVALMARNVWQDADKLLSRIRRTTSLDWREFNFFKAGVGLSRYEALSIQVCLDYELAREWRLLVELLAKCSDKQRQDIISLPETYYYAAIHHNSVGTPLDELPDMPDCPPVPTVCIAASWFPAPWLSGPAREREKIVKKLAEFYSRHRWVTSRGLHVFDFPMEDRLVERCIQWAKNQNKTLHVFAINRAQTESGLVTEFRAWVKKQPDISGKESRRGRVKPISALRDLGCYRLMTKLDALSRQTVMDAEGFKQSVPKLSEAKQRAQKRLRSMGYI
jgi:hypothetical protein